MENVSKLEQFLISLSEDAEVKNQYVDNPQEALEKAGLNQEEIVAVLTGDTKAIETIIGRPVSSLIVSIILIDDKKCD